MHLQRPEDREALVQKAEVFASTQQKFLNAFEGGGGSHER